MVPDGHTSTQALADTAALARRADELGYTRFQVAEHHNMETVASTSAAVLMAHLAQQTTQIHLGSGGVMLPNHASLAIAEQFALLEALHPGRVDLGIGRAPGTDLRTAAVLRRTSDDRDAEDFPRHLLDLMGLLGDVRKDEGLWDHFRATPVATSYPSVFLLGSSGFSAQLAGLLGLPFVFANHFDMGGTEQAAQIYRQHFEPSAILSEPHTIVTASVITADTTQEAHHLAGPSRLRKFGMRTGQLLPLFSPADAAAHPHFDAAVEMPTNGIVGTPDEAITGLEHLADATEANELMLHVATHGLAERLQTIETIYSHWN